MIWGHRGSSCNKIAMGHFFGSPSILFRTLAPSEKDYKPQPPWVALYHALEKYSTRLQHDRSGTWSLILNERIMFDGSSDGLQGSKHLDFWHGRTGGRHQRYSKRGPRGPKKQLPCFWMSFWFGSFSSYSKIEKWKIWNLRCLNTIPLRCCAQIAENKSHFLESNYNRRWLFTSSHHQSVLPACTEHSSQAQNKPCTRPHALYVIQQ